MTNWLNEPSVDWRPPDQAQRLLQALTAAYSQQDEAHYVAMTVGLDVSRLEENKSPFHMWRGIIQLAAAMGLLGKLVQHAVNDPMIAGFRGQLLSIVADAADDESVGSRLHLLDPAAPFDWKRSDMQQLYRAMLQVMRREDLEMFFQFNDLATEFVYWAQAMAYVMKDVLEFAQRSGALTKLIRYVLIDRGYWLVADVLCGLMIGYPEARGVLVELLDAREEGCEAAERALVVDPSARPALRGLLNHHRWGIRQPRREHWLPTPQSERWFAHCWMTLSQACAPWSLGHCE